MSNFFGFEGSASTIVDVRKIAIPSVYIQRSPEFRVNVYEDNFVTASIQLSACQEDVTAFNIRWTIAKVSNIYVDPPAVDQRSVSTLDLLLPSGSLEVGSRYIAIVSIISSSLPTISSGTTCTIIGVGPQFSTNMIQGGSRSVGFYDPIILELIPEIGYTASLASSWSCSPAPCFSPFSPGIQVVDKTMYVAS